MVLRSLGKFIFVHPGADDAYVAHLEGANLGSCGVVPFGARLPTNVEARRKENQKRVEPTSSNLQMAVGQK